MNELVEILALFAVGHAIWAAFTVVFYCVCAFATRHFQGGRFSPDPNLWHDEVKETFYVLVAFFWIIAFMTVLGILSTGQHS